MSAIQQNPLIQPDPLIDEIREIRRLVSERSGTMCIALASICSRRRRHIVIG